MRYSLLGCLLFISLFTSAQIGVKAGLNFANISKTSYINNSNRSGFHAGVFLGTGSRKILGFRTEFIYSSQGYNYKSGTNSSEVTFDYLLLPQMICINFTKYIQVQAGGQLAYLMKASNDSSSGHVSILDYAKRFDYGIAAGVEIHPVKHFLLGARFSYSLGKVYKDLASGSPRPSFLAYEAKNSVFQLFAGLKLGK